VRFFFWMRSSFVLLQNFLNSVRHRTPSAVKTWILNLHGNETLNELTQSM
jgi:hypothetical protein